MGVVKEAGVRIVQKVAKRLKATPMRRSELEQEFAQDPSEFVAKYAKYLKNDNDVKLFRSGT